ncbi:MAG: hypothetical protein HFI38_14235 [Lachnospiraceae bacterium]|nr:hypothetical protein [Lachnospiraceae bacterium]
MSRAWSPARIIRQANADLHSALQSEEKGGGGHGERDAAVADVPAAQEDSVGDQVAQKEEQAAGNTGHTPQDSRVDPVIPVTLQISEKYRHME